MTKPLAVIIKLPSQLKKLAPRFCKYVKAVPLVVRVEDGGNITSLFKEDTETA